MSSSSFPIPITTAATEVDLRGLIAHGDAWPESRPFIVKTICAHRQRPDLIPFDWPERTTTPISVNGVSWLLPDAHGNVNQPVVPDTVDICPANGVLSSAGESVIDAIRSMRSLLSGIPDEIAGQRVVEQRTIDREESLLRRRRAARRRRVPGGHA